MIIQNDINYINKINEMLTDNNTWLYRSIEYKIANDLFKKLKNNHDYFCFCMVFHKIKIALNNVLKRISVSGYKRSNYKFVIR